MYRITVGDYNYIGHTKDFVQRKRSHKSCCLDVDNKKYHFKVYQMIREAGGWDKCQMVPIEEYEADSQLQARIREEQLLKEYNATMNSRNAFTDKEEYRISTREKTMERCREWYKNNKERHAEYGKLWREANREKHNEHNRKYRAAKKAEQSSQLNV